MSFVNGPLFTNAFPWPGPEGEKAERNNRRCVLLEESLRSELLRLGPQLRVVVDHVVREPDVSSFLYLDVSKLAFSLPVLHTESVIPRNWSEHSEVFLQPKINKDFRYETYSP